VGASASLNLNFFSKKLRQLIFVICKFNYHLYIVIEPKRCIMKAEKNFLEFGKEKMEQASAFFEELEVQFNLGKAEAKDAFDREKKNFSNFVDEQRRRLKVEEARKSELLNALEVKMELLADLLVQPDPTSVELYDRHKEAVLRAVYDVEGALKNVWADVGAALKVAFERFRIALDAYRISLALSSLENKGNLSEKKAALEVELSGLLHHFQLGEREDDRLEHFTAEMETAFEHIKKAVKELIK
jgi:hypothetical protein